MSASPRVFLVLDPCQDYEETTRVLGAYGSLRAAQFAAEAMRRKTANLSQPFAFASEWRCVEVQEWQGSRLLAAWEYSPSRPEWQETEPTR